MSEYANLCCYKWKTQRKYLVLHAKKRKRENKEEIDFIQHVKRKKYINENQQNISEDIKKIFERYIKENAKNIEIITVKEERVRFFDGEKENIGLTNFKGNMPTKRNIGGCRKNISWKGI